jgi:hypothetical protein
MFRFMKLKILLYMIQDFSLKIEMMNNNKNTHINKKRKSKKLTIKIEVNFIQNKNS